MTVWSGAEQCRHGRRAVLTKGKSWHGYKAWQRLNIGKCKKIAPPR